MTLPAGWYREYEGRHGAEFFYEPRNLTVSVLPRYESALGRASEKDPSGSVVRVHRLLTPAPSVPMTLGERETFDAAKSLATKYMQRVDSRGIRSASTDAFAAFTDVANYDDDVLVALCRSLARSPVTSVVHYEDGEVVVAHAQGESPASVRTRLTERVRSFATTTEPGEHATYVVRDAGDLAWLSRGGSDGTLVEFANAHDDVAAFLDEIGAYVRRRAADSDD